MKDCIFCKIVKGEVNSWKVYENEYAFAFFDIHPMAKYHTLVIPKKHYVNIFDIPEKELKEIIAVVKKLADLYKSKLKIKNIQIINSSGEEAQQDVPHFHFHIAPREKEDGQDLKWKTYPQFIKDYDKMLKDFE